MVWTDFTAPTTVDDAPSGWTRGPVTVHLTAGDAKAGVNKTSGAWHTNVSLTGPGADGVWQVASSVTVAGEGEYTLAYYSTDQAANAEAQKTCRIRLDNSPPVPAALAHVAVTRGRTAKLRYRVRDTWSPACTVTIKVVNARGRTVKTFRLGSRPTGVSLAKSFRCTLPKGTYRWQVHATDAAGNVQARAGSRLLIVR
jgi:hypothetical protein